MPSTPAVPGRMRAAGLVGLALLALPGVAPAGEARVLPPAFTVPLDSRIEVRTLAPPSGPSGAAEDPRAPKPFLTPDPARVRAEKEARRRPLDAPLAPSASAGSAGPRATVVQRQFDGLANVDNGAVIGVAVLPPDPNLAAGPDHLFQMVKKIGRISDKAGTTLQTFSLNGFFQVAPGFGETDPHLLYDLSSGRWIAVYLEYSDALSQSAFILAVSQTGDPTGVFCRYRLGNPTRESFILDFPMLGVSTDKIVVSYNGFAFPVEGGPFIGSGYYVVNKADAMACLGSVNVTRVPPSFALFSPWPSHAQTSTSHVYLAMSLSTMLGVLDVDGVPGVTSVTESTAFLPINAWTIPPNAEQPGSSELLDSGDTRVLSVAWRSDSLWLTGNEACVPPGDVAARTCLRVIEARTDTMTIRQDMTYAGAPGDHFFYAALRPDAAGNLLMVFTHVSASVFPGVRVTGRFAVDPLGTLRPSTLIRAGGGPQTDPADRMGDFAGAALDPSDPLTVWVIGEYIRGPGLSNWGTWVAQLRQTFMGGVFVAAGNLAGAGPAQIVTAPGPGLPARVRAYNADGTPRTTDFAAFPDGFLGGARVAVCDFDGDGRGDILVVPGPGGGPQVRLVRLDPVTGQPAADLVNVFAYDPGFVGGLFVACGDLDGDGRPELILGVDAGGGPHVRIFSYTPSTPGNVTLFFEFFAYDPAFRGGVRVAAGNVDGSDRASLILGAGPGGGPHVRVLKWNGSTLVDRAGWFAYDPSFEAGIFVAAGNVLGGPAAQVITGADAGGGAHVRVWTGGGADTGIGFFAYDPAFRGGVRIAVGNVDGAGSGELITGAGPGGGPHVGVFAGTGGAVGPGFFAY